MKYKVLPFVLAGGGGTRLWPLSRRHYPKQFLKLKTNGTSLLQSSLLRIKPELLNSKDIELSDPSIICNEEHRFLVAEQAKEVNVTLDRIVLEPVGKNTSPALTVSALLQENSDAILVMMPADQLIENNEEFADALKIAIELASKDYIVTLGIKPVNPETGYGYIEHGDLIENNDKNESVYFLKKFIEKPNYEKAVDYLNTGNYSWNSGIFILRASTWLKAIKLCSPAILEACKKAVLNAVSDVDFLRLDESAFRKCPSDSIDYSVMEHLNEIENIKGAVVSRELKWSDVGSWNSLWFISDKDRNNNLLHGDVFVSDIDNSIVYGEHRFIAAFGLSDIMIVETVDAVLVAPRDDSQQVKNIVAWLNKHDRTESLTHRRVYRPWGNYESLDSGERYQVKRITVNPGHSLSLQLHHRRAEHWIVVHGIAEVVRDEDVFILNENESTYIPIGMKHRLSNRGNVPLEIIEVQSGDYLGEDDIVRFDDKYNRQ